MTDVRATGSRPEQCPQRGHGCEFQRIDESATRTCMSIADGRDPNTYWTRWRCLTCETQWTVQDTPGEPLAWFKDTPQ